MHLKNVFSKIGLRILYLTPIGYLLSLFSLLTGEKTKGIYVVLENQLPIWANIKQNPTSKERISWFVNGIVLLAEGFLVLIYQIASDFGGVFAIVAIIFGLTSMVAALFPRVSFNKKIF